MSVACSRSAGGAVALTISIGQGDRLVQASPPEREARAEHADRPLVPAARLAAVVAVGLSGLPQHHFGLVVLAADQVDLRERVEDRAGCLVKLDGAAQLERPLQGRLGAGEVAHPHADLPEGAESRGEAVPAPVRLVQAHAALDERQRLVVLMLEHHHDRLVRQDRGQHVVGVDHRREALGLAHGADRLLVAAELRERHAGERLHERQVAAVAGGVQRGGGLRDVLADDGDVADLAVALAELVVGEADRQRVVGDLGLAQRAAVQGDRARLVAAREGDAAVEAPERGEPPVRDRVAESVGRAAEHRRGLLEIVLEEARLGERAAERELVLAAQGRRAEGRCQQLGGFGTHAAFERGFRAGQQPVQGRRGHAASIAKRP